MKTKYDYFLSYSRDIYEEIIMEIIGKLERFGLNLWFDRTEVTLGCNIYTNIHSVLKCVNEWHGAIVVIDSTYIEKEWCNLEANYFINNNIKCIPILYKITKDDLPPRLQYFKRLNIATVTSSYDIEVTIDKILMSYIYNLPIHKSQITCPSKIISNLIHNYKQCVFLTHNFVFTCEIICQALENLVPLFVRNHSYEAILISLIHYKTQILYKEDDLSYYEYTLIRNAINYVLDGINVDY